MLGFVNFGLSIQLWPAWVKIAHGVEVRFCDFAFVTEFLEDAVKLSGY